MHRWTAAVRGDHGRDSRPGVVGRHQRRNRRHLRVEEQEDWQLHSASRMVKPGNCLRPTALDLCVGCARKLQRMWRTNSPEGFRLRVPERCPAYGTTCTTDELVARMAHAVVFSTGTWNGTPRQGLRPILEETPAISQAKANISRPIIVEANICHGCFHDRQTGTSSRARKRQ
jgi:hypothetical protein